MSAVWRLVKVAGAQDKEDVTVIRPVGGLGKVSWTMRFVVWLVGEGEGRGKLSGRRRIRDIMKQVSCGLGECLHSVVVAEARGGTIHPMLGDSALCPSPISH
jgi:hypothetical protein